MSAVTKVSRRSFLQTTGLAGSALVLGVQGGWSLVAPVPGFGMETNGFEPNVWVSIGEDGVVQLTVHRQELGQGGLALLEATAGVRLVGEVTRLNTWSYSVS